MPFFIQEESAMPEYDPSFADFVSRCDKLSMDFTQEE